MHRDIDLLKQDAQETAQHLADNILELEQRVSRGVERMSPASLIRRHPVSAVGTAALLGFAGTYWFRKIRPAAARIANDFGPEIKLATKIGAGLFLERFSERLSMPAENGEENNSSHEV